MRCWPCRPGLGFSIISREIRSWFHCHTRLWISPLLSVPQSVWKESWGYPVTLWESFPLNASAKYHNYKLGIQPNRCASALHSPQDADIYQQVHRDNWNIAQVVQLGGVPATEATVLQGQSRNAGTDWKSDRASEGARRLLGSLHQDILPSLECNHWVVRVAGQWDHCQPVHLPVATVREPGIPIHR